MTTLTADEASELAESVRAACERLAGEERIREIAYSGDGFDRELWNVLCRQIGVTAISLPEDLGGAGYGTAALGVVAHELGRALAPVPFLATAVLAVGLLTDLGGHERVAAIVDGRRTAAAAVGDDAELTAQQPGDGWTLSGTARHVLHASAADDLILVARVGSAPAVFIVDRSETGVTVEPERVLDPTRPMATVTLSAAPAQLLGEGASAGRAIIRNVMRAIAVLSAEQVGAHEKLLEMAAEYARTRVQFGRPIGGFQAIKHRCADVLTNLEWSRSASLAALQAVDQDNDESSWLTSLAKAVCSEGLRDAAHANVQIHGGIGFTWEDAAHLYLKRARTDEVLFGLPSMHWDRVAMDAKLF